MIDTSALGQRSHPDVRDRLAASIEEGATVCDMVVAESLIRSRSPEDLAARKRFFDAFDVLPINEAVWDKVTDFAEALAEAGEVVAPSHALIAAYETLGRAAGVDHEWVAPNGSL